MKRLETRKQINEATDKMSRQFRESQCDYPRCKCIVSTSTSNPVPLCPFGKDQVHG